MTPTGAAVKTTRRCVAQRSVPVKSGSTCGDADRHPIGPGSPPPPADLRRSVVTPLPIEAGCRVAARGGAATSERPPPGIGSGRSAVVRSPAPEGAGGGSLDADGGAGALEGRLRLVRGVLVDLLEDRLRRAVDEVLGLLEAEGRERAHLLDDLDLLVADRVEDDVELVLLLLGGRVGGTAGRRGGDADRDGGRGLDVEGVLEGLHELRELDERELLERVEQLVGAELRHGGVSFRVVHAPGPMRAGEWWISPRRARTRPRRPARRPPSRRWTPRRPPSRPRGWRRPPPA